MSHETNDDPRDTDPHLAGDWARFAAAKHRLRTHESLAVFLGLTVGTISRICGPRGHKSTSLAIPDRICHALGISRREYFQGSPILDSSLSEDR